MGNKMIDSEVLYYGNLRTESKHIQSGNKVRTDAPIDNNGKGEAFSPTDLVATSLANCMLTVMGITANRHNIDINGTRAEVSKIMGVDPRRIIEIKIEFYFLSDYDIKYKKFLEQAAINCPVAKSLSEDLIQNIQFSYGS
jgi:uncharacterized OsmC-like protein|tara:strand:- start:1579 stop:1998 length:420 start_codon:yes stop_codon:yes gene_type:complete